MILPITSQNPSADVGAGWAAVTVISSLPIGMLVGAGGTASDRVGADRVASVRVGPGDGLVGVVEASAVGAGETVGGLGNVGEGSAHWATNELE